MNQQLITILQNVHQTSYVHRDPYKSVYKLSNRFSIANRKTKIEQEVYCLYEKEAHFPSKLVYQVGIRYMTCVNGCHLVSIIINLYSLIYDIPLHICCNM